MQLNQSQSNRLLAMIGENELINYLINYYENLFYRKTTDESAQIRPLNNHPMANVRSIDIQYIKNQIMSVHMFNRKLPDSLITKISLYLYKKDEKFIVRWMQKLSRKRCLRQQMWKRLERDTKSIALTLQDPTHNFAYFIEDFIIMDQLAQYANYFKRICIQCFNNNPKLIFYHNVGNDGYPFQTLASLLVSRTNDNKKYTNRQQTHQAAYDIFKHILSSGFIKKYGHMSYLFSNSINISQYHTAYSITTTILIFKYCKPFLQNYQNDNGAQLYNTTQQVQKFMNSYFTNIFKHYEGYFESKRKPYIYSMLSKGNEEEPSHDHTRSFIRKLLEALYDHCYDYLVKFDVLRHIARQCSFLHINQLYKLTRLMSLIEDPKLLFHLFRYRKRDAFCKILKFHNSNTIEKFQHNGMNLMEYIADNRGLTHNFITTLLQSNLFTTVPPIRNKKSSQIIRLRFPQNLID